MRNFNQSNTFVPPARIGSKRKPILERIRDVVWSYPERICPSLEGGLQGIRKFYINARPISAIVIVALFLGLIAWGVDYLHSTRTVTPNQKLVEGVLGVPNDLNPIYIPNLQVQKDVNELVFNNLFDILPDGSVVGDLVSEWEFKEDGKELHMIIRPDVFWHDGEPFSVDDVKFTVELYKKLQGQNSYFDTVKDIEVDVVSESEIVFRQERASASFLETIVWPILPKHLLENLSVGEFETSKFGFKPIGTGPFKFSRWTDNGIILERNLQYYGGQPKLESITFTPYSTEMELVSALLAGKIDSTVEVTATNVHEFDEITWIKKSAIPLYRRYWAVYLNFNGPEVLKDKRIRQALSSAVNREKVLTEILLGYGVESMGPIQEPSWAYNADATRYRYDPEKANQLFSDVGYSIPEGSEYLEKDGSVLELELSYVSNPIQDLVAESVVSNWEAVGVKVNLSGMTYKEFRDTQLIPRNFDTILFGVESLLDPDHFLLWHSSQSTAPGRNFSSYKSSYTVIGDINRVDDLLEKGKATLNQEERKNSYCKFQTYLLDEVPAIFLYHPSLIYLYNSRIHGIDLSHVTLPEERFRNVVDWQME